MAKIGIIGGSGLYEIDGMANVEEVNMHETPFGSPSDSFMTGTLEGTEVVFLARHGRGHRVSPSELNYRANIYGMKKLGVEAIISVSACGSLREEMKPLDFVVPDQFVDRTNKTRESSFFTDGIVAHVAFADPFAEELRVVLIASAKEVGATVHPKGTYIVIEGPQFSTKAESNLYRSWGMDIIGMTNLT
ncbi:MAG: MTAP family purine nucleoside phosphorylase, partial [Candidatus Omnitrophica bacterium]|nr:MTAP family purine nucleoside phosphorylase [Candidatus Omnitrophota bacterium]